MTNARVEGRRSQQFPSYLKYQCDRLLPVAKMLLVFSVIYLLGFGLIDVLKYPEQFQPIVGLRLMAAVPLMYLISLMNRPQLLPQIPMFMLILGLVSFGFFLFLNLTIPGKRNIVVLVPVFYILVILAMAPLFKIQQLILAFLGGTLVYYWAGFFYIQDNDYVRQVFPHMTAIVIFTLITVAKIKQSAEENYQLAKDLHWRSQHDELTKVLNRHGIFDWIESNKLFTGQSYEPISLAMLDLDHFKQINDEYGHDVGDEVIQNSAELLTETVGPNSAVARFGGEEFLLVLQEGSDAQNLACTERILQRFRHLSIVTDQDQFKPITVSIGFVNHRSTQTFAQSLKRADDFLYQAKQQGRDQLVTDPGNLTQHG
ncbi:GGDEF domain-containing protein [Marinicella meishanensis]|uniref:GGDEF domain-containing protein n=1 Tax=Marinicella meishanensis TaxID=2873263 RepID=UPI001CBF573E|nr:GGDEF domain-containing protein [Marinicella sp. NBU2979]